MNPSVTEFDVSLDLELPEAAVAGPEVDLIEAHLGPLLRQFLFSTPEHLRE